MHILIDIGGTKTRVAGALHDSFGEPVIFDTPRSYEEGIRVIASEVRTLTGSAELESIMIGIRGELSPEHRVIRDERILMDWSGKQLADDLRKASGAKSVSMENDVALVGLGEAVYGAGKDSPIVMYMTVSTGVNGVRIVNGEIDASYQGFSMGGQYLSIDPAVTFEDMVSGSSVEERFGKHPKDLGKDHAIWEELARITAFGVHNAILHWSPHKVVLGGSMFNEVGIPIERIREHTKNIMKKFRLVPEIVHGELGDLGGLWGGLALLKKQR